MNERPWYLSKKWFSMLAGAVAIAFGLPEGKLVALVMGGYAAIEGLVDIVRSIASAFASRGTQSGDTAKAATVVVELPPTETIIPVGRPEALQEPGESDEAQPVG